MKQKILYAWIALNSLVLVLLAVAYHVWLWPFELLLSFTPLALIGSGVSLLFFLGTYHRRRNRPWKTRQKWGVTVVLVGFVAGLYCLGFSMKTQPPINRAPSPGSGTLRFATFNKLYTNLDNRPAAAYFREQKLDIIGLQEILPSEVSEIRSSLGYEYGYASTSAGDTDRAEVGLVSRLPLVSTATIRLDDQKSAIRAEVQVNATERVVVYVAHVSPPFSLHGYKDSVGEFDQLAQLVGRETLPVVLGGDFNTTIFSPKLRSFNAVVADRLHPVTQEAWPACSWFGLGPLLCLRIDHVYIPKTAHFVRSSIAPFLGSDHRAVIVEFTL